MTGCIVLDPFGGSGSTLIASEQTERICYTIELDEKYCDVIVKRFFQSYPDEPFLLNGEIMDAKALFGEESAVKNTQ